MVIAVLNSKGGVGKSTIAVHAAVWLREQGYDPAVIDADAQASTSEWLAKAAPDMRIERCDTTAALAERLPRLTSVYQLVLADGPAALSHETVALAAAADLVLLPIGPSMMDVWASYRTARVIYRLRLRENRSQAPRVFTILNRVQPRTRLAQVAVEAARRYGFPIASTPLRLRQAYAEACGLRTVVWRMGPSARAATEEIARLFNEVLDTRTIDAARRVGPIDTPAFRKARQAPSTPMPFATGPRATPAQRVLTPNAPCSPVNPRPAGPTGESAVRPPAPTELHR